MLLPSSVFISVVFQLHCNPATVCFSPACSFRNCPPSSYVLAQVLPYTSPWSCYKGLLSLWLNRRQSVESFLSTTSPRTSASLCLFPAIPRLCTKLQYYTANPKPTSTTVFLLTRHYTDWAYRLGKKEARSNNHSHYQGCGVGVGVGSRSRGVGCYWVQSESVSGKKIP